MSYDNEDLLFLSNSPMTVYFKCYLITDTTIYWISKDYVFIIQLVFIRYDLLIPFWKTYLEFKYCGEKSDSQEWHLCLESKLSQIKNCWCNDHRFSEFMIQDLFFGDRKSQELIKTSLMDKCLVNEFQIDWYTILKFE